MNVLDHGFVRLVDSMPTGAGSGDQRIVDAARVSIQGKKVRAVSDNESLIRYLYKHRHTTPFETVQFTFHVAAPMFVARQWMRHRTGTFNEESARYGQLRRRMYVPALYRMHQQATDNKQGSSRDLVMYPEQSQKLLRDQLQEAYRVYETLLAQGLTRELARIVLPTAIYTQFYWSVNLHNLFHFVRLRLDAHAQYEIREYAMALLGYARIVAPVATTAFSNEL